MPPAPVLVDSSWYIRLARQHRDPLAELARIEHERDLATCGVVRCEVGRGLRTHAGLGRYRSAWGRMIDVPTDHEVWRDAAATLWELDRAGLPLPVTDIVIACCARRIGAVVLTFDDHFRSIPGITTTDAIG